MGVAEMGRALDDGAVSSLELSKHLLARFAAHHDLGTLLCSDESLALRQAEAADARRARGEHGPLLGVPIAHKDIFVTRDLPSTAGSRMLDGYRSPFDAAVLERLGDAGAVTLGKLNCDEFAMGSGNENSAFGVVRNPWDTSRVPAVRPAARPRRWRRGCCRPRPAPTPAGRSASRQASPASPASSRRMASARATAWSLSRRASIRPARSRAAPRTARCCSAR